VTRRLQTGGQSLGERPKRIGFAIRSLTICTSEVRFKDLVALPVSNKRIERVYLLNHILKLVVEPKHEHPDVQKLNLNVKKLEEITMEALSGFFADKENPANFRKKPYLTEIFRVAKQQERFKNDEIGELPRSRLIQHHVLTGA
jgi:hypothetical protein